jgi:hypothetical protein
MPLTITNVLSTVVHSANSEMTTLQTQCGYAEVKMRAVCNTVSRVSALLIRWSRVRISPDPPVIKSHLWLTCLRSLSRGETLLSAVT